MHSALNVADVNSANKRIIVQGERPRRRLPVTSIRRSKEKETSEETPRGHKTDSLVCLQFVDEVVS